jgi:hypothetical protein
MTSLSDRRYVLWESVRVKPAETRIIDTSAIDAVTRWKELRDKDAMPVDAIVVVVHPQRVSALRALMAARLYDIPVFNGDARALGAMIAKALAEREARRDG